MRKDRRRGLNVDDLNAGGIVQDNQQHDETDDDSSDDADGAEDETAALNTWF
jgi:hypothetical protein